MTYVRPTLVSPALPARCLLLALTAVLGHLERYLAGSADDLELRAEDLRAAAAELGRLTGRIDLRKITRSHP